MPFLNEDSIPIGAPHFFSFNKITKGKARRNQEEIVKVSRILVNNRIAYLKIDTLKDLNLKARLEKLNAQQIEVVNKKGYYPDSVVVFSKSGFPIAWEEIVFDISNQKRNLRDRASHFTKVADRIYFRKVNWVIS